MPPRIIVEPIAEIVAGAIMEVLGGAAGDLLGEKVCGPIFGRAWSSEKREFKVAVCVWCGGEGENRERVRDWLYYRCRECKREWMIPRRQIGLRKEKPTSS